MSNDYKLTVTRTTDIKEQKIIVVDKWRTVLSHNYKRYYCLSISV